MRRFVLLIAVLCAGADGRGQSPPAAATESLSDFYKPGTVFQDRNGDGVVDFVNARIVLADEPTAGELAAAADVAARFGFETTALNLPIDNAGAAATVFVGARALHKSRTTADALGAASLKPGDGFVGAFHMDGKPAVAILGGDDTGVTAAAMTFAGHLPYVWDQKTPTTEGIAEDIKQFLTSKGVAASSVTVPSVTVRHNTDGIERLLANVSVPDGNELIKAQVALYQFKATGARDAKRPLSYPQVREIRIRVRAQSGSPIIIDLARAVAPEPPSQAPGRRPGGAAKDSFDLSTFYSNEGALGDSDNNLIPDRTDTLLSADGEGTSGIADLAARLGLESAGVTLPIAKPPSAITEPGSEPPLVLIGVVHPLVTRLIESHKWVRPRLEPAEGLIQVVKKAFGEKSAVIVTGGDANGVARAVQQLAERFPHIWARGKDRTTLDDVEDDVRKFVSGRSPAGQGAMSLYKLRALADRLKDKDLASARIRVFAEKAPDGLAAALRSDATDLFKGSQVSVDVQNLDVQKGRVIVADEFDVPSEVDELWTKVRTRVIPAIKKRQVVAIEARLSEPAEVRRTLEQAVRAELIKAGADEKSSSVTVLSAYKQGYSWLYDVVRRTIAEKRAGAIGSITIRFAELGAPERWKQQGMFVPTRWLLEIYPIDEVLAKELDIDVKKIRFEMAPIGSPAYEVIAKNEAGAEIVHSSFEPKFVERPFFDRFPDYEHVRVTTGWLKAEAAGRPLVDERIATDPERFWDRFQSKTLPALYDHVMALGKGKPRAEDAPFFGELTVDLTLSEPEYTLPVDQEFVSSMEAIHEEIYFNTLHFFDVMGRFTRGAPLTYPGRVIPLMHPKSDGKSGHAKISITGFDAPRPSVVVEYVERNGKRGEAHLDIPKIAVDRPQTLAAFVRAGANGLSRLDLRVKVDSERDEREALIQRTAEERVDRAVLSAEQVTAVFNNLTRLRAAGLYRDALAYHDLHDIRVTVGWEHESTPNDVVAILEPNGTPADFPDIRNYAPVALQWDEPIPPPEAYGNLARMSAFKHATVYKVGESYLGKEVWAMDLMPPVEASHWSQAKQSTMKPTVIYSARQHANEVSSTSHVLKLADLLLTDAAFTEKLNKVNVVVHPITNADGAQLAYDLQKANPHYMLHAGYLGSLGVDVVAGQWDTDPIYPESSIRPKLWRTWLPDIFLNPHGYPSHEWVQLFSEYAAWVRTRAVETRDYWTMRGWWMPGFAWLDDPRYPRHKTEQMKLLNIITEYVKAAPETVALNERAYDRYKRYSFDFDQKNFKLDFTNGVLIYKSIKGGRANPQANDFMTRNPNVTIWDGSTEAPDETAHGDWMKLVANAGLQWDKAILDYLVQGHHEIERKVEPFWNGVSLSVTRPRPPRPPKAAEDKKRTSDEAGKAERAGESGKAGQNSFPAHPAHPARPAHARRRR